MNILLIQPRSPGACEHKKNILTKLNIYPALGLEQIAGNTDPNHKVTIVHEDSKNIKFGSKWDLIGISCTTPQAFRAYEIAAEFKKRGIPVILGGPHPSALPEEAKQYADSVVIGEADVNWPKLLIDLENGNLKQFYRNDSPVDLANLKMPNRRINSHVSLIGAAQATRGCPQGCEFCGVTNSQYGKVFRTRPIEKVIEDLCSMKQKKFWFYDPSLTTNPTYSKQLFKAMKGLNKKFVAFGNMNVLARDDELLKLSRDAGCITWYIGFESVSQETIDKLGKTSNKVEQYADCVKKIHDHGISTIGAFIFGFDTDTRDVFEKTKEMIYNLSIDIVAITNLTPYPGTPLYERLEREGRILTKDWTRYTELGNVVFQPKYMSPQELLEGTIQTHLEFQTLSAIIKRVPDNKQLIAKALIAKFLKMI
jgi:radical SAM superfamily enzyme YgiQ (UPF0313 family)